MRSYLTFLLAAAALVIAACGDGARPAARPVASVSATPSAAVQERLNAIGLPRDARIKVSIRDASFQPTYIQGRPGQTLVFENDDDVAHRIKAGHGVAWDSGALAPGDTYAVRVGREGDDAGEWGFDWTCTIHRGEMYGSVTWTD